MQNRISNKDYLRGSYAVNVKKKCSWYVTMYVHIETFAGRALSLVGNMKSFAENADRSMSPVAYCAQQVANSVSVSPTRNIRPCSRP